MRGVISLAVAGALLLTGCGGVGTSGQQSPAPGITTLNPGALTVCMYPGFAPFESQTPEGEWVGYEVTYLQDFARSQNLKFQVVSVPEFNGIWTKPGKNECDVAASGIAEVPSRVAQTGTGGQWSDHYYRVMRAFATRKPNTLNGVQDLAGQTVIVTKGSTADIDLTSRIARGDVANVTVEYTDNEKVASNRVASANKRGEPFAYGGGLGSIQAMTEVYPNLKVAWVHCLMLPDGQVISEDFSYITRTESAGLADALNTWINTTPYPGGKGNTEPCGS